MPLIYEYIVTIIQNMKSATGNYPNSSKPNKQKKNFGTILAHLCFHNNIKTSMLGNVTGHKGSLKSPKHKFKEYSQNLSGHIMMSSRSSCTKENKLSSNKIILPSKKELNNDTIFNTVSPIEVKTNPQLMISQKEKKTIRTKGSKQMKTHSNLHKVASARQPTRSLSNRQDEKSSLKKGRSKNIVISLSKKDSNKNIKNSASSKKRLSIGNNKCVNKINDKEKEENKIAIKLNALKDRLKSLFTTTSKLAVIMKPN